MTREHISADDPGPDLGARKPHWAVLAIAVAGFVVGVGGALLGCLYALGHVLGAWL